MKKALYTNMPDEEVLSYIHKEGCPIATTILYKRYEKFAYNYLLSKYNGDYQKAGTMYNYTYTKVLMFSYNHDEHFIYKHYLSKSLKRNVSQEYWKEINKTTNSRTENIDKYSYKLQDSDGNKEDDIIKKEGKKVFFSQLKNILNDFQYNVLMLHYIDGWSYEAIGNSKGISQDSVRGHLDRIRQKIRKYYKFE